MKPDLLSRDSLVCVSCGYRAPLPQREDAEPSAAAAIEQLGTASPGIREADDGDAQRRPRESAVTSEDLARLPQIEAMIEREAAYFQRAFEYAEERYDEECRKHAGECPDYLNLEPELYYKQVYTWFVCEWVMPSTGETVLEEFVKRFVAPRDPEIAGRMLQERAQTRGSFRILDSGNAPLLEVLHLESGRMYLAITKMSRARAMKFFERGSVVRGKIHPWGERYYMFDGILAKQESDEEVARRLGLITPSMLEEIRGRMEDDWIKKYEDILVNANSTLRSVMNKYPSQWVDATCSALGIDISRTVRVKKDKIQAVVSKLELHFDEVAKEKLGERHVQALAMLLENGWVAKYGQLSRAFSTEIGFSWNERPPTSEIGTLRLHGLVTVGRLPEAGRLYKVALVPMEVRAPLKRFLLSSSTPSSGTNKRANPQTSSTPRRTP